MTMTETTTTTTNSPSPNHSNSTVVDCDCFLLKLVDSYLKLKGLETQRIESVVKDKTISHPFDCLCQLGFTESLSHSLSVQLEKDEPMHSQHFSKFGNVFDPSFPNNKLKLYLCGIFAIDPKSFHSSSRLHTDTGKLSGAVIFNFLVVLCSIAEKIFTTFPEKPLREREDVIIACIHTADYFKNSILIPDWLLKHGGWTALAKVAEKIALTTQSESSSNWRDMLPGAAVLASGMAALGIAVIARR
ncbi:uncharacterized protein LOC142341559 [Convolutriloba macropyga]|uniref:uncharacterized protein LOC142341559 n=1 Tax=Convolutriloba macropyga TaxID=536237 RepID=UPI003F51CDB4